MSNELGKFLEELRGKMSLRTAAERSGLSHSYIRDIELGENRVTKNPIQPTPETLEKLSIAYNYSYDDLMKKAGFIKNNNVDAEQISNDIVKAIESNTFNRVNDHILTDEDKIRIQEMLKLMFPK